MSSTFTGFSEEDLKRIKSNETGSKNAPQIGTSNIKKLDKIGAKTKRPVTQYKLPILQNIDSDDNIENLFNKCKLSIKTPTSPATDSTNNNHTSEGNNNIDTETTNYTKTTDNIEGKMPAMNFELTENDVESEHDTVSRKSSRSLEDDVPGPDIIRCVDNYTEDELAAHKVKLADLQLKQKLMEEQNKKRKEMLSKALADRTKQTSEEIQRLEKIKRELQVLDGQFSQDVAVLRKKIDQACLLFSDAEKHYLRVEKEFLQAKINLQKEKEKKELLTEHLCALITHNETRKAQKLETLMLELATDVKHDAKDASDVNLDASDVKVDTGNVKFNASKNSDDEDAIVLDGVCQKTGKMVELTNS